MRPLAWLSPPFYLRESQDQASCFYRFRTQDEVVIVPGDGVVAKRPSFFGLLVNGDAQDMNSSEPQQLTGL